MNKIKFLYDVVTTMKEKEVFKGTLTVEGTKGENKVLDMANEFEKNTQTGQVKTKIRTEVSYGENIIKHESITEFKLQDCHHKLHLKPVIMHTQMLGTMHCHTPGLANCHAHSSGHGGFKDKMSRLAFILNTLNSIQIVEKDNGIREITLELNNLPECLQKDMHDKFHHQMMQKHQEQHGMMAQLPSIKNPQIKLRAQVNEMHEVLEAVVIITGDCLDEGGEEQEIHIEAELNFIW